MAIKIENLEHVYMHGSPFEKKALDNINITIEDGEFVGLIGHTGSGKSTLVQHLNGLLKPQSGKVIVNGRDTSSKGKELKNIRFDVGLVFQYPEHQLFEETVRQDIAFSPANMGLSETEIEERVKLACEIAGVDEKWLEKSPFELSGGQKRRVAIAGVLAMQPQVLVLDEPTAGLDPKSKNKLLARIRRMHDEYGITIILVSHDMEDVANCAERVIVLNDGEIFAEGTPLQVFSDYESLEKIGVTAPQITRLMDKLCGIKVCRISDAVNCITEMNGGVPDA